MYKKLTFSLLKNFCALIINRTSILLLLIFLLSKNGTSQTTCNCKEIRDYDKVISTDKVPEKYFYQLTHSDQKACQAIGYYYLAQNAIDLYELDSVDFYLQKQQQLLNGLGCTKDNYYNHYYLYSNYYFLIDDLGKMVEAAYSALQAAEYMKDENKMFSNLANLCLGYKNLKQPKLVRKYATRLYAIAKNNPDKKKRLKQLTIASVQYMILYQDFDNESYLDTVKLQIDEAFELSKQYKDTLALITCYRKTEAYYYYKGNYPLAIENISRALTFAKNQGDYSDGISPIYADISDIYIKMKSYPLAKIYADSAVYQAKIEKLTDGLINAYQIQIEVAKAREDYKTAYKFTELLNIIEDSVLSVEKHETIYELEQKYQKAQDGQKISGLEKDREINHLRVRSLIGIVVVILLVLIVIVFMWRQNRIKNKLSLIESEQRLNRARINPHFFFNAMTSIQLVAEEEKSVRLPFLISKFAKIMRASLESTYADMVTIDAEIEFITNYLTIQRSRYMNKFDFEILKSEDLDSDILKLPSMILQPFLENSIEHGFKNIDYVGHLQIEFMEQANQLTIQIRDNGSGFKMEETHKTYPSRAKQIVTERLTLLDKLHKSNSSFSWANNEGIGVLVTLHLPIIQ